MSNSFMNTQMLEQFASDMLDDEKFVLVCDVHRYTYSLTKPPNFKCKKCMMVNFVGLLCNTPREKMRETVEMLEYSIRKLVEADNRGEIDRATLYKHPKITIEQDDGSVIEYNKDRD
jgi:hypothetical protein